MKTEELNQVTYVDEMPNMMRVSHSVEFLEVPPSIDDVGIGDIDKIDEQIRKRKQVMCSMDAEIEELKQVKRRLNDQ